jgi:hypothetical protein
MIATIIAWFVQTWTSTITAITHDLAFYLIATPVVAAIAYVVARAIPVERQRLNDEDDESYW